MTRQDTGAVPKTKVVFAACVEQLEQPPRSPIFYNTAFYQLKAYLEQFDEIASRYEFEIVPFMLPPAGNTTDHDIIYQRMLASLLRGEPGIIAFSLYVWNVTVSSSVAQLLAQLAPGTLLFAGGPEVYERPRFVEQFPHFDVIFEGDGELSLREVLQRMLAPEADLEGVRNVSYRTPDGAWVHNKSTSQVEDINQVPNFYVDHPELLYGHANYMTTRGCSFACTYCLWAKQRYRVRSPEKILAELETIMRSGRVEIVSIWDYDLLEVIEAEPEIGRALVALFDRYPDVRVHFFSAAETVASGAAPAIISQLNIDRISVGIQSTNPDTLEAINRPWSAEQLSHLARVPEAMRPLISLQLVYPMPEETPETFLAALRKLVEAGYHRIQIFPLMVLRGTAMSKHSERWGLNYLRQPPYYCMEVPSAPRHTFWEMLALSAIFEHLEYPADFDIPPEAIQRYFAATPDLLDDLLASVRAGEEAAPVAHRLLTRIEATMPRATQAPASLALTGRAEAPVASWFPYVDEVLAFLHDRQPSEVAVEVRGDCVRFSLTSLPSDVAVLVEPRSPGRRCYTSTDQFALSYAGELREVGLLDELAAHLAKHEAA